MKKFLTFLILSLVILSGASLSEAKTTKKKRSNKGYKIENGVVIPTGSKPIVIDFYADWCGPCRQYKPVFEEVKSRYKSKAIFLSINIDQHRDIANAYNIHSVPTTYLIHSNGVSAAWTSGSMDIYNLERFINSYLNLR